MSQTSASERFVFSEEEVPTRADAPPGNTKDSETQANPKVATESATSVASQTHAEPDISEADSHLFETAPISRLFFHAAIPGAFSMIASSLYSTIDSALIGLYLGSTAFAASNLAMPFIVILFGVSDLIGVGSSVPIAIALGQHDEHAANNAFSYACLMIELVSAALGILVWFAAPWLMQVSGASGELADLAVVFLRVYAASLPVTAIFYAVDNYMRICGKTRESMLLNVLMTVLGGVLEYIAIVILGWGMIGAALGFAVSLLVCTLIAFVPFVRGNMDLKFCPPQPSQALTKQIVFAGTPVFLNNIAGRAFSIVMNYFLLMIGGEMAVSVCGIILNVDSFFWSLLYGMSDAVQPAMSYNWGAKLYKRVLSLKRWSFSASAVCSVMFFAIVIAMPQFFIQIFMSEPDPELLAMAIPALRIASIGYLANWIAFTAQTYLMAIEHSHAASVLSVCSSLVFPLVLIVVLWPLGLLGMWLNIPIGAILSGVLAVILVRAYDSAHKRHQEHVRTAAAAEVTECTEAA